MQAGMNRRRRKINLEQLQVILLLVLLLTACRQGVPTGDAGTAVPSPGLSVTPTASTPSPAPPTTEPTLTPGIPVSTPALTGTASAQPQSSTCEDHQGSLVQFSLRSEIFSGSLTGKIYLPPCYNQGYRAGYPVLYLLHGILESEKQWLEMGLQETADRLISGGDIPPLLVVMPREETWERPPENLYGRVLIEELIPWINHNYHVHPDREYRAVGGVSRGGNWALRLGLMNWNDFGAVGVHSAPLFYGDQHRIAGWLDEVPAGELPALYLDTGADDQQGDLTREVEQILTRENVLHSWHLFPGTHNLAYWSAHLEDYLRWYSSTWGD